MGSDIEAAKAVKEGQAGVMIGSCATGQGGAMALALAMAIAIAVLGRPRCQSLAPAGCTPRPNEVRALVAESAVAFGVVPDAGRCCGAAAGAAAGVVAGAAAVVPPLVAALLAR